jgi:hypothetical protein
MLSFHLFADVLVGEPASTPDRVGGRLSPEHALASSLPAPAIPNALLAADRRRAARPDVTRRPNERLT